MSSTVRDDMHELSVSMGSTLDMDERSRSMLDRHSMSVWEPMDTLHDITPAGEAYLPHVRCGIMQYGLGWHTYPEV